MDSVSTMAADTDVNVIWDSHQPTMTITAKVIQLFRIMHVNLSSARQSNQLRTDLHHLDYIICNLKCAFT